MKLSWRESRVNTAVSHFPFKNGRTINLFVCWWEGHSAEGESWVQDKGERFAQSDIVHEWRGRPYLKTQTLASH